MKMQNDFQVQSTSIVDVESDLFNKHARYVRHYTGLRFQGDAAIHRNFGQETLNACDSCCHAVTIAVFFSSCKKLKLPQ